MFISWRFLQIGTLSFILSACASPQAGTPHAGAAPDRPPQSGMAQTSAAQVGTTQSGAALPARTASPVSPEVEAFAKELSTTRDLPTEQVLNLLQAAQFNPTVSRLIAPAASGRKIVRSWTVYRQRVVEPVRIRWGVDFWNENQDMLAQAAQRYGVPAEIIVAIIGVETNYARNMGSFSVLDALYTLGFQYPDPSRPERQTMFRNQLGAFLTLVMAGKLDVNSQGSFAGAMGMSQFMPGSIESYAVDGDGDGVIDLINSRPDAILSIGNFLVEHGWQRGLPVFAPVRLPSDSSALVDGGLTPHLQWSELQAAGARTTDSGAGAAWMSHPVGVVNLPDDQHGTVQYRTGTPNFFALTHYNRSYFYATSVADLAQEVKARRDANAAR